MSRHAHLSLCVLALHRALAFAIPHCQGQPEQADLNTTVTDDTELSLIYSIPLVSFAIYAAPYLAANGSAGINVPHPQRHLATAKDKQLVKPNADTLYTPIVYDLSQHDLVLHVPEYLPGRYWSFSFFDPYGDNYDVVGVANDTAGDYLLILKDSGSEPCESVKRSIESSTAYGIVLARNLLLGPNETALDEIHAYQDLSLIHI